jgi:putative oxidoreductase
MTNPTMPARVRSTTPSTVLRLGVALVFLGAGCGKLLGVPPAVALFHTIGFGEWFRYAVGSVELVGAVLLAIPTMARRAALGLVPLMVGAAGTEVIVLHRPPALSLLTMAALIIIARARPAPRALGLIGALAGTVLGALTGAVMASTAHAQPATSNTPGTQPQAGDTAATSKPATSLPPAGSYTYIIAADSSDDVRNAVNRTVEPMSFITRPIARGRLNATNPTPQDVKVNIAGDTLGVAFDGGTPVVTPLDGATVPWQSSLTHETYQVHAMVQGDTVS